MPNITKSFVDKLPPSAPGKADFHFDDSLKGFGVRVSGSTKTYIVQAYVEGKKERLSIGRHGVVTVDYARREAIKRLGEMAAGESPSAKKRSREVSETTLRELFQEYKRTREASGGLRPKTVSIYEGALVRCFSDWLDLPVVQITGAMVLSRFQEIATTEGTRSNTGGAKAQAAQAFRVLRSLLNYAKDTYEDSEGKPFFQSNPVDKLTKVHRGWSRVAPRNDVIDPTDLAEWYHAILKLRSDTARDFLLFCLFTGLRRTAASKLKWSNVNFKAKTLFIPATDDKTGKEQKLPAPEFVLQLLHGRKASPTVDITYVFPGDNPGTHFQEPKSAIAMVKARSGVSFSTHTLRRTFATVASKRELAIPYYAVKNLLNHSVSGDVTGHHYVQIDVEDLREPMEAIAAYLQERMNVPTEQLSGTISGAQ